MKRIYSFSGLVFVLVFLTTVPSLNAQGIESVAKVTGGVTTLYAYDPLFQSLCLRDGGSGSVIQDNEVRNRCSDINFNSYNANGFTVGVEGGREGVILDIGSPAELQKKYAYEETVGKGQGFASMAVKEGKVYVLQDRRSRSMQELKGVESLFQTPTRDNNTAQLKVGNIYIMRLTDRNDKKFECLAKLIVIAHVPGESVTFRWQIM
jgi:hypothetical protein